MPAAENMPEVTPKVIFVDDTIPAGTQELQPLRWNAGSHAIPAEGIPEILPVADESTLYDTPFSLSSAPSSTPTLVVVIDSAPAVG